MHPYPIPEEEEDGGSVITGSGIGNLNCHFCGSTAGIILSEWKLENDFLLVEAPGILVGSRNEKNRKRTQPWCSSLICSISFICLDLWIEVGRASSSSIAYRNVVASHLTSFGVKTYGLSSSIWSKTLSFVFNGKVLKNFALRFGDIGKK